MIFTSANGIMGTESEVSSFGWYISFANALDNNIPKMKECLLESGRCLMQTEVKLTLF